MRGWNSLAMLALWFPLAAAQKNTAHTPDSVSICGHVLSLGMSSTNVVPLFISAPDCEITSSKPDNDLIANTFFIHEKGASRSRPIGVLEVEGGNIIMLEKRWDSNVETREEYAKAIIGLFTKLEAEGNGVCKLSPSMLNQEAKKDERGTQLSCGTKIVLIGYMQEKASEYLQISEILQKKR